MSLAQRTRSSSSRSSSSAILLRAIAEGSVVRMVEGVRPETAELAIEISLAVRRAAAGALIAAAGAAAGAMSETRLPASLAQLLWPELSWLFWPALSWLL